MSGCEPRRWLYLQQSSKNKLAPKSIIRPLSAALLLLVFSFSITPRKYLHDAIANHKDATSQLSHTYGLQYSNTGFICKCDDLVAESPFTSNFQYFQCTPLPVFSVRLSVALYHFQSTPVFFFELRGPPAATV
jgi:hypothetical protein